MFEITVNYWAIIVGAVLAMALGALWYGPLFGKKWMEVIGAANCNPEERKKMQQAAAPLYIIQFILTLLQVWVLAYFVNGWVEFATPLNVLWIWAAFVVPTLAGSAMWNNDSKRIKWARFLIQAGYQLVIFILFALVLTYWR